MHQCHHDGTGHDRGGGLCPQLILFGLSNQLVVAFKKDYTVAFKHLLLKGYEDGADDTQAIYIHRDLLEHLAFVLKKYLAVPSRTLGHCAYGGTGGGPEGGTGLWLCQGFFCRGDIDSSSDTFDIDPSIVTTGDTRDLRDPGSAPWGPPAAGTGWH
ncbi:mucolipin-1-like isoform X1 [Motacilla alba alba]|uniref:mucolipin-1-like isoform X1 n=1 Tax=Motacilla alba alba TaxID=1094192 RepID=UPI0018D5A889|nr:mucolipin-1-like isoform X1 [Motacilla alba alba]